MIVEPPGDPKAATGSPRRKIRVGAMELLGRLPAATSLAPGLKLSGSPLNAGMRLKSVSSLFNKKPNPSTRSPVPQADSIVLV